MRDPLAARPGKTAVHLPECQRPASGWLAPLLIAVAVVAAYSTGLRGPFVYDDIGSIVDNPSIRHLWPPWSALHPPAGIGRTVEGRPVLNLSFAVNAALGGLEPWNYHALNIAIHGLAALTLFGIVRRTLQRRAEPDATPIALGVALLWALHPLNTGAVTYVVQRAESLMGLFLLVTLYAFIRHAETGSRRWGALSAAACALGMGTKEVMVTAPVLVLVYDRIFIAGSFRRALRERRVVHAALFATWLILAALVFSVGGNRSGSSGFGTGVSWGAYELTQSEAIARYLRLAVVPYPLVFDSAIRWLSPAEAAPYAELVVVAGAATIWALVRAPSLGYLGFWFFGILSVTSLVPGNSEMIAERRMYLPLAALATGAVIALHARFGARAVRVWLPMALGLGAATAARNLDYRTDVSLWTDTVARVPGNARAVYNLGVALSAHGDESGARRRWEEALTLDPRQVEALHSLGTLKLRHGDLSGALAQLNAALALRPADARIHYDLGTALQQSGALNAAVAEFESALRLDPGIAEAQDNLGIALAQSGRIDEATRHVEMAVRMDPGNVRVRVNLAGALADSGRLPEARAQLDAATRADPSFAGARFAYGNLLARQGQFSEAILQFAAAVRLDPTNTAVHRNLGMALLESGRTAEAIPHFEAVLRMNPDDADTLRNLAVALRATGREDEARALEERADTHAREHR